MPAHAAVSRTRVASAPGHDAHGFEERCVAVAEPAGGGERARAGDEQLDAPRSARFPGAAGVLRRTSVQHSPARGAAASRPRAGMRLQRHRPDARTVRAWWARAEADEPRAARPSAQRSCALIRQPPGSTRRRPADEWVPESKRRGTSVMRTRSSRSSSSRPSSDRPELRRRSPPAPARTGRRQPPPLQDEPTSREQAELLGERRATLCGTALSERDVGSS